MLGPLIGTALNAIGGYVFMLNVLGLMFFISSLVLPYILPKYLDQYTD